jgi:hypothetical protein
VQVDQGRTRAVVAHPFHEFPGVRALVGDELIASVPQVVEVDAGQAGRGEGGQPDTATEVGVCQGRAGRAGEDEWCALGECPKVVAQVGCDQVSEGDGTATGP